MKDIVLKPFVGFPFWVGKVFLKSILEIGRTFLFFLQTFPLIFARPRRWKELINHMEFIGNQSLLIIILTGSFTGLALAYQIYIGFSLLNAQNMMGPTVALGIVKELAPVLTGLIVAARAGGAMAAQLGTMRVTEQIDALEVIGVDPKQYLIAPRLVAAFLVLPFLCGVFDFASILSAELLGTYVLNLDAAIFWDKIQLWLEKKDIIEGLIKSAVFGLTFAVVCTRTGYETKGGARGVGQATNKGVVYSMVLIIVVNFFLSNIIRYVNSFL